MNNRKSLSRVLTFIIPALIIGLWVLGAFHAKKKHNINPLSSDFFVCWYYGLEIMWHQTDYKELNDEIKTAALLIMAEKNNVDPLAQPKINERIIKFKKSISKLDKKEFAYVKKGANTFVEYLASLQQDMINAVIDFKETREFTVSESDNSIRLSKECSSYGLEDQIQQLKDEMSEITKRFNEQIDNNSDEIDESLIDEEKLKVEGTEKFKDIIKAFEEIFNE